MKTMWKGAIQFGLVSIPVRMYTGTSDKSLGFHQLHDEDMGRIRYHRVCHTCGQEVPFEDIIKGYEIEKDRHVPLTEEDLEAVEVTSSRAVDIAAFVKSEEIDPIYYERTYYLAPEELGAKPYHLLRQVLQETDRAAVAKITLREKEHLALIRPMGEALVLETMHWPDEIRELPREELRTDVKIRDQERQMAVSLIDNLTEDWNPQEFRDEDRDALMTVIEQKAAGETVEARKAEEPAPAIDLMDALKASVEAAKKRRTQRDDKKTGEEQKKQKKEKKEQAAAAS